MEINRENVLYAMTVGFPCMTKYEILGDLELKPTKENGGQAILFEGKSFRKETKEQSDADRKV